MALGILSLIAILLMPALKSIMENSVKAKEDSKLIFAIEEAIELEKVKGENLSYGNKVVNINGFDIEVIRERYSDNLDKITARSKGYELSLIEVVDEKKWIHPN